MAKTMRVENYIVEVTPVTTYDPIAAAPPLPPIPDERLRMADTVQPSPPRIPWVFIASFIATLILMLMVARGLGR